MADNPESWEISMAAKFEISKGHAGLVGRRLAVLTAGD
jgi:hypothetical protein